MASSDERRGYKRKPISMEVKYKSVDMFFYDYAINISHGGIFIKTRKPLARGADVAVEFDVPGFKEPLKVGGKVVRVIFPGEDEDEPSGMGIEFEPLNDKDKKLIDDLWQKNSKKKK